MRPGLIRLRVGELILHGFEAADRERVGAALERELARLLAGDDAAAALAARAGGAARLDAGAFEMGPHAGPDDAGARLARAVYDGLKGGAGKAEGVKP